MSKNRPARTPEPPPAVPAAPPTPTLSDMFSEPPPDPGTATVDQAEVVDPPPDALGTNSYLNQNRHLGLETNRTLMRGGTLPPVAAKAGADPLHLRCLDLFEKLLAGGVIFPWANLALDECAEMVSDLRAAVSEPGSEGGV